MSDIGPGSVIRMTSFKDHFVGDTASGWMDYKAQKGKVAVFMLLGDENKDGSEPLDCVKRMHELGWMTQKGGLPIIGKAKEAVAIPSDTHSDIGDVLLRWVKGEITDDEGIAEIECYITDYRKG